MCVGGGLLVFVEVSRSLWCLCVVVCFVVGGVRLSLLLFVCCRCSGVCSCIGRCCCSAVFVVVVVLCLLLCVCCGYF